jgi:hypothetical protein
MGKNGNGEGSIYSHKRNGKKVGYREAYVVQTAEDPKRRYVSGNRATRYTTSSSRPWATAPTGSSSTPGLSRSESISRYGLRIP